MVQGEPTYTTQWVNGTRFKIGAAGDTQVWVTFESEGQPSAFVYLVNASARPITFEPAVVALTAHENRKGQTVAVRVQTFSAEEYEEKVRTRQAWQAALVGLAAGLANQPQPTTSTFQGNSWSSGSVLGPNGSYSVQSRGTYSGMITTWPTAQDYSAASAKTAAQVAAMSQQLERSFAAMAAELARTHTLAPSSYYGGLVYFAKSRANQFEVKVPFAGQEFRFTFAR